MIQKIDIPTFRRGLETTQTADGAELPVWPVFQNTRLDTNGAKTRPGIARAAAVTYAHTALDFDGSADYVSAPVDSKIQTPGRFWAYKTLIEPDSVTGTQTLYSWDSGASWPFKLQLNGATALLTIRKTDNSEVTATGGTIAIGSTHAIMVTRRPSRAGGLDTEDVELWVDGTEVGSIDGITYDLKALSSGGPLIGIDNGPADGFDGTIDHATYFNTWLPDQEYGWMRTVNPKASNVVFDYWMEEANATTNRCDDRSRHRNHATITSAPGSVTGLAVQTAPISLLAQRLDSQSRSRLDVVAGDEIYLVTEPLR